MPDNSGIMISGNDGGNYNINTGSGSATQHVTGDAQAATLRRIDELIEQIVRQGFSALPAEQVGTVAAEAKALQGEVHATPPDNGRVSGALSRLRDAVSAAAPVAELAAELAKLVAQLLH
jgi:hypothetical protein